MYQEVVAMVHSIVLGYVTGNIRHSPTVLNLDSFPYLLTIKMLGISEISDTGFR
jgi:hypothetical protein